MNVLEAHLSLLPKGLIGPGTLCMSYMSVTKLCDRLNGMTVRTFNRCESKLAELGLIHRKLSANARRFPIYHPATRKIIGAYGIDLSPLFDRYEELLALRERISREAQEWRNRLTQLSCDIPHLTEGSLSHEAADLLSDVRKEIARLRRLQRPNLPVLQTLEARVAQLQELTTAHDSDGAHGDVTSANADLSGNDSQTVRRIESKQNTINKNRGVESEISDIRSYWDKLHFAKNEFDTAPSTLTESARILQYYSNVLDVSPTLITDALSAVGWKALLLVLDKMAVKRFEILRPARYFQAAIEASLCNSVTDPRLGARSHCAAAY